MNASWKKIRELLIDDSYKKTAKNFESKHSITIFSLFEIFSAFENWKNLRPPP